VAVSESPSEVFRRLARHIFKESLLLALLVTFFAIVTVPEWKAKPYEPRAKDVDVIELPPELKLPEKPKETVERPQIPVEAEDDEEIPEEETIAQTILDENAPVEPEILPDLPAMGEFVAYDTEPQFIKYVVPEYPELARKAGVEGVVVVNLLVDTKGQVVKAVPVSGPEILRDSAVKAALQCLLTPALQRDKPVAVWVALPFRFRLKDVQ
jgi:protein TonB